MEREAQNDKATIRDVARAAGVSKSTVSLVLRGSSSVSPRTAENVKAASKRLGYVYNRTAANLRNRRTHTFGVIASDIGNPYFAELFTAIADELERQGIVVMLSHTGEDPERQRHAIATLLEHNVDGLFISPAKHSKIEHLGPLPESSVPSVFVGRYVSGHMSNYIGADNILGARMATEHLLSAGHRRIAFIGGAEGSTAMPERVEGFRQAFARYGLEPNPNLFVDIGGTRQGGYLAIGRLLAISESPTAAFCYNDVTAFGVLMGLTTRGIRPGRDFAVFGFDDVSEARIFSPALSTVSAPPETIGKRAAEVLVHKIENQGATERILITPSLSIRESCGTRPFPDKSDKGNRE